MGVSEGGLGGFKKGVGFEGFWPTHTTAPRISTTQKKKPRRRAERRATEREEETGAKGNKNQKRGAKQLSKARRRKNPEAGEGRNHSARGLRDLSGSGRGRSEGDRCRARAKSGGVCPAC